MPFRACGSLWNRWDLHFHTPSSFDYQNKGVTNDQIVACLAAAGVSVVAITDHHTIDMPRIQELQALGGDDLTVLPGIEFRTELGGKDKVHLIGIFREDCNLQELWTMLCGKLELTPDKIKDRGGDEAIYVDFQKTAELIRAHGGVVTTHVGRKNNSIESIGNNETFKIALKTDLARDFVDIYEVGRPADCEGYETIVFQNIGKRLPLIMGSDNHDATKYQVKTQCWIKGDPSFQTFQQLCSDPQRAALGDSPGETARIESNPTKYVAEVSFTIAKGKGSDAAKDWQGRLFASGRWDDRVGRALRSGYPVSIEQDLAWYVDPATGRGRVVVSHTPKARLCCIKRTCRSLELLIKEPFYVQAPSFSGRDHPGLRTLVLQVWDQLSRFDGDDAGTRCRGRPVHDHALDPSLCA